MIDGQEEANRSKRNLKFIKGGQGEPIVVQNIGEYKKHHPSNRRPHLHLVKPTEK